jgi:nitrate reductase gamma subunit/ferredoxin
MSYCVETSLLPEIQKYGAADIQACFNCGNCTAVCPLADDEANFPRRLVRYAQLGMKERLAASKDVWMCYYCGECSATCPRQAEPGEFMAAARRYAIAHNDVTGLSKLMYKSTWFNVLFTILLGVFFGLFMLTFRRPAPLDHLVLFQFIPEVYIQVVGIALFVLVALAIFFGWLKMIRGVIKQGKLAFDVSARPRLNWWAALWETIAVEFLGQKRYRHEDCEEQPAQPWFLRKWVVHASILYGFLGLFGSTALDFLFKPIGSSVPLYFPMRLLGTSAGLLLMYGTTVAFIKRLMKRDKYTAKSHVSDWMALILLWLMGLTGFLLEISVYALLPAVWGYALLIIHVALAMDLLTLVPVSKFAHVLYRTTAIFLYNLRPLPEVEHVKSAPAEG